MKQLFLTSEVKLVAKDIGKRIVTSSGNLHTVYITTPTEKGHEEDDLQWSRDNKQAMVDAGFDTFDYSITGKSLADLKKDLNDVDVVYVEGGSLVHMMNQVRISGFEVFIKDFLDKGGVYIGTSTGSFIAAVDTAPGMSLEFYTEDHFDTRGMGLINFLVMPHWGTETFKESYEQMPKDAYGMKVPMIILNDAQYVFVNNNSFQIIDLNNIT
ncbi:MAG: Type 1 glutamine amidotransferase-like domain-containing protein [Patescibacteria group bacterium]